MNKKLTKQELEEKKKLIILPKTPNPTPIKLVLVRALSVIEDILSHLIALEDVIDNIKKGL